MVRGVTHAEYIRAQARGRYYFMEIAARVGGSFIADQIEVSTGVNMWREWARLEVCYLRGELYVTPASFELYAGSVLCPAETAESVTSGFDAPEIVARVKNHHRAGLIVRSTEPERVKQLLEEYSAEFARRFPVSMLTPES